MKKPKIKLEVELSKSLPKFDFIKNTTGITKAWFVFTILINTLGISKHGFIGYLDATIVTIIVLIETILIDVKDFLIVEHERLNFDLGKYLAELEKRVYNE